jgi:hypothetical protein
VSETVAELQHVLPHTLLKKYITAVQTLWATAKQQQKYTIVPE